MMIVARKRSPAARLLGTTIISTALGAGFLMQSDRARALDAADPDGAELATVVVTSRNREESVQDVPIPVSVVSGATLERDAVVALEDLVKKAPGLEATTPNSRRTGISIRGIGKSAGNDALEASMGVIVNGVFLTHPGMTYQDFTDLDRVEVLRGPQGTLLGKNTTIGVLNYVSRAPSFTPEGSANFFVGARTTRSGNASYSDAIIDDELAYRASLFVDKQDGDIANINAQGGRTHEKNREGGRVQFLYKPTSDLSVRLDLDYAESNERSNTQPTMLLPTTYDDGSPRATTTKTTYLSRFERASFAGYTPLVGVWTEEDLNQIVPVLTRNDGASLEVNWSLGGATLTSITGVRNYYFDAKNDSDYTKYDVGWGGNHIDAGQTSEEIRLSSAPNETLDYQVGLFYLHGWNASYSRTFYGQDAGAWFANNASYNTLSATAAGRELLTASLNNVYSTTVINPDTKSYAAFGQVNWHLADRTTLTLGLRDTYEKKTNASTRLPALFDGSALNDLGVLGTSLGATAAQIAAANTTRSTTLGASYSTQVGVPVKGSALSWLVSPSYQLTDNALLYASVASGEKSGSVQFSSTGTPLNVDPEKVFDIEAGIKSLLLNRTLQLNINLYQTRVRDYQQVTSIVDDLTTQSKNDGTLYYQSVLGNIPGIRARGLEFDVAWSPIRELSIGVGGAYNDAIYTDWRTGTCPGELNITAKNVVCDNTGKTVVAAPKFSGTLDVDYRHPVLGGFTAHVWGTNVYRTRQNFDVTLSRYGWQGGYSVTDLGAGLIGKEGKFEIDLLARNAFDTQYTTSVSGAGSDRVTYDGIGQRRWVGLVLHARF